MSRNPPEVSAQDRRLLHRPAPSSISVPVAALAELDKLAQAAQLTADYSCLCMRAMGARLQQERGSSSPSQQDLTSDLASRAQRPLVPSWSQRA